MRWAELTTGKREAPEPLEGNIQAVVAAMAGAWVLALLVLLPFHERLSEQGRTDWLWTCVTGAGLGLLGLWYVRRREAAVAASTTGDGGDDTSGRSTGESGA